MSRPEILDTWNSNYFDGQLSEVFLNALSPFQGEAMGSLLARILPGDWSDRIPPITTGGRHVRLDNFILNNSYRSAEPGLFLDIGCGFPPITTLDTVEALNGWRIVAADPSLPSRAVYDIDENYATFDAEGRSSTINPRYPIWRIGKHSSQIGVRPRQISSVSAINYCQPWVIKLK